MKKNAKNPRVDVFLREADQWREEMGELRRILLECPLDEEIKWSKPCYSFQGGNVVIIQPFKAYCALLFFKGVLLKDPKGILVKTGENTVVGRQIRFMSVSEIRKLEKVLKEYVQAAIEVEKAELKVEVEKKTELNIPEELQIKLDKMPALEAAFYALTPGRQRAYTFYFSAPKQSKTRTARIEKCMQLILDGKGLNDDYLAMRK